MAGGEGEKKRDGRIYIYNNKEIKAVAEWMKIISSMKLPNQAGLLDRSFPLRVFCSVVWEYCS